MLFSSMTTATGGFYPRRILQQVQPSPQPVQFFLQSWVLVRFDLLIILLTFLVIWIAMLHWRGWFYSSLFLFLASLPHLGGHGPLF